MKNTAAILSLLLATAVASPVMLVKLPRMAAPALDGRQLVLSDSVSGSITLVGFAYRRESQADLGSWLDPFRREFLPADGFRACEVPMMGSRIPGVLRGVINSAMRKATPLEAQRWVAPFYGDIDGYSRRLGISDRGRVQMFLLDGSGIVRWHAAGRADSTGLAGMRFEVARLAAGGGE